MIVTGAVNTGVANATIGEGRAKATAEMGETDVGNIFFPFGLTRPRIETEQPPCHGLSQHRTVKLFAAAGARAADTTNDRAA